MSTESVMPSNHLFLCHPVGLVVNFCTNYTLIITEALEILIVSRVSLKFIHTVFITFNAIPHLLDRLNGPESEQTPGDSEGLWGCTELDTTEAT